MHGGGSRTVCLGQHQENFISGFHCKVRSYVFFGPIRPLKGLIDCFCGPKNALGERARVPDWQERGWMLM